MKGGEDIINKAREDIMKELASKGIIVPRLCFMDERPETQIEKDNMLWWICDLGVCGTLTKCLNKYPEIVYHITKHYIGGKNGEYVLFEAWCDNDEYFGEIYKTFEKANDACEKHLRDKLTKEQKQ